MSIYQRGYVTKGETGYEFDDRRERLRAAEGEAFFLPGSPCSGETYREDDLLVEFTRLLLVGYRSGA